MEDTSIFNRDMESVGSEIKLKNGKTVHVSKYSALDERMQEVALKTISDINKTIITDNKKTWEECNYTSQICQRVKNCLNAKNTLFIALDGEKVIGYVAFYTRQDNLSNANKFLKRENEAYCSWTAVDEKYRGQGLAEFLKLQIFEPEHRIQKFRGHLKTTNIASLRVLNKFSEMLDQNSEKKFKTSSEQQGHQYLYTVKKRIANQSLTQEK